MKDVYAIWDGPDGSTPGGLADHTVESRSGRARTQHEFPADSMSRREEVGGSQMKTLVAGATGTIGRSLITELRAKAYAVVALIRSPEEAQAQSKGGIEPAIGDFADEFMRAAIVTNHPNYVNAIVTTKEVVEALLSVNVTTNAEEDSAAQVA